MAVVTVEPVEARTQLRRFADVPYVLHRADPRWSRGVRQFEQWRIDARRHPYFDRGDAAYFLARRDGAPVGRIAAHVPERGVEEPEGRFGFFDAPDDREVVDALLDAAREWLRGEGATSMTGPLSWTAEEEFGVLTSGFEHGTATAMPWRPAWYAEHLVAAGGVVAGTRPVHHLSTEGVVGDPPTPVPAEPPPHAGPYADPALVLDGIAAVPDVTDLLAGASVGSAWRVARAVRERAFRTAVCVRWQAAPADLVPGLLTAARAAGYHLVLAPWAPAGRTPEQVRSTFRFSW